MIRTMGLTAWLAALLLCSGPADSALAATAAQQRALMQMLAQAYALTRICLSIEMNEGTVAIVAAVYGLDLKANGPWMVAAVEAQMAPWAGKPAAEACATGIDLYGTKGKYMPHLVQIR